MIISHCSDNLMAPFAAMVDDNVFSPRRNKSHQAVACAISLGGDSDTIACIAGDIAEALYGIPDHSRIRILEELDDTPVNVMDLFTRKYY